VAAPGSIRLRATLGAVAVVAVVLIAAAVALVLLLDGSLTANVRTTAMVQAETTAGLVSAGALEALDGRSDDEFVQLIEGDQVVGSTSNVSDAAPIASLQPGESAELDVPFDDDPFVVVATDTTDGKIVVVGRSLDAVVESLAALTGLLVAGVPMLLLLIGLVTWHVIGRALAPVERIRSEVDEISTGELHRRVPEPGSRDEIGRLAITMNRMLGRLQAGDARQRRFVSDASHELRAPVSTIRQHAELALAHPGSTSTGDLASTVLEENLRLQRLVDDLLLLTATDETGPATRTSVDLDDVVLAEAARLQRVSDAELDASKVSAGRVNGDGRQLARLVSNLLENASHHARDTIAIELRSDGTWVVLTVDDDGPGVPPGERERVFERFVRLDESRARTGGGSGLGLAIVSEVAAAHGGRVDVGDSPLGGARFTVRLPELPDGASASFSLGSGDPGEDDR